MQVERKRIRLRGHARTEQVRRGTGSDHEAVILDTPEGEHWILVRVGGNPFLDVETLRLSGRNIEVDGYCVGSELRYVEAREI